MKIHVQLRRNITADFSCEPYELDAFLENLPEIIRKNGFDPKRAKITVISYFEVPIVDMDNGCHSQESNLYNVLWI